MHLSESAKGESGRAFARRLAQIVGLCLVGFLAGGWIFNAVVMPGLTGRGAGTQVPDLIGRRLADAEHILREERLERAEELRREFSAVYPDGYVIDQDPEPLTRVKRGAGVQLVVSFGREGMVVPDVRGASYRDAQVSLSRAGLRLGRLSHAHAEVQRQQVVATTPEAGALTSPGARVDVLVSLGPPVSAFVAPDLRGYHIEEAHAFFDRSGIRLMEVPVEEPGVKTGEIVGQRPLPGRRIRPNDVIEVDVAGGARRRRASD